MLDFSIHDVRFRRTARDKCWVVVRGQTVGEVRLVPPPADPADPRFGYRIELYDAGDEPCFVRGRGQVRLAIADRLWNEDLVPHPVPAPIAAQGAQLAFGV